MIGLIGMFTAIAERQGVISFEFLRARPDLSLTLSASPETTERQDDLTYTVRVANNGSGKAKKIVVNTTLPEGVMFMSSDPGAPACFESKRVVNCRLGALETGEQIDVVVVVKVEGAAPETLVATATVETSTDDSNLSDNSVTFSTSVK